jgi:hypothetical protein
VRGGTERALSSEQPVAGFLAMLSTTAAYPGGSMRSRRKFRSLAAAVIVAGAASGTIVAAPADAASLSPEQIYYAARVASFTDPNAQEFVAIPLAEASPTNTLKLPSSVTTPLKCFCR